MFQTTAGPEEHVRWLQLLSRTYWIRSPPGRKEGSRSLNLHSLQQAQRMQGAGCEYSALPEKMNNSHFQVNRTNLHSTES